MATSGSTDGYVAAFVTTNHWNRRCPFYGRLASRINHESYRLRNDREQPGVAPVQFVPNVDAAK